MLEARIVNIKESKSPYYWEKEDIILHTYYIGVIIDGLWITIPKDILDLVEEVMLEDDNKLTKTYKTYKTSKGYYINYKGKRLYILDSQKNVWRSSSQLEEIIETY